MFDCNIDSEPESCAGAMRRNKRSVNDLKHFPGDDDDATMSTSDDSEQHVMTLDEQGSSFLFGGNETANCLKRELKSLPMAVQERASQDMYGITDDSMDITQETFESLEREIQQIQERNAYDTAVKMEPDYVKNKRFRLMFLRACQGDAKKAAKRITRHFSTKLNLFGIEKLVKNIELSDLDEYDMEALQSGGFQVLPKRDLAGRNVLFGRYTAMRYREIKNMVSLSPPTLVEWKYSVQSVCLLAYSLSSATCSLVHMDVYAGRRSEPSERSSCNRIRAVPCPLATF